MAILVEGPSKASRKRAESSDARQLTGRTPCDRIVVFEGPDALIGQILPVQIEQTGAFTLFGTVVGSRQYAVRSTQYAVRSRQ